jgi:endoglycosylceramidase
VYSQEYLKKMKDIVDLAGSYGIYSLVEFHQDIASEKFCGDGIPAWLIPERLTKNFPSANRQEALQIQLEWVA